MDTLDSAVAEPRTGASGKRLNSVFLFVAVAANMMGVGLIAPILPLYAREFGVDTLAVGLTITVFGAARLLVNIPAGVLSDRFGRVRLLLFGQTLVAGASLLSAAAPSIEWLLVFRAFAGAGSGIFLTGALAYVADYATVENRGRVMSTFQGSQLVGVSIGPAIGGLVSEHFGFRSPFLLVGVIGTLCAIWVLLFLKDNIVTRRAADRASAGGLADLRSILRNRDVVLIGLIGAVVFFTRGGTRLTILPIIAVDWFGFSVASIGFIFVLTSTLDFACIWPSGFAGDRWGRKTPIVAGLMITLVAVGLFCLRGDALVFLLAAALLGVGSGLSGPSAIAYVADVAPEELRGLSLGVYRTFGDLGLMISPPLLGFVAELNGFASALLLNGAIVVAIASVFLLVPVRKPRRSPIVEVA